MNTGSTTGTLHVQSSDIHNRKVPGNSTSSSSQDSSSTSIASLASDAVRSSFLASPLTSSLVDEEGYINIDAFVANMEQRLNKLAEYGLETLSISVTGSSVDPKELTRMYNRMVSFKNSLVTGGIEKAENFVAILETQYNDIYDAASVAANRVAAIPSNDDLTSDSSESSAAQSTTSSQASDSDSEGMLDSSAVTEKALNGLHYIEDKLAHLEELCLDSITQAEMLNNSIQSALYAAKNRLLTYEELPHPWRDNPYIRRGYRFCEKYTDCFISVATLHNETCNIWTHLVGLVIMVFIAFYHYPTTLSWTNSNITDKLTMITFLAAASKCLFCSTVWHTCNSIYKEGHVKKLACVDYTGITVLIAASIITTEYCAFYCRPIVQALYITITALSGLYGALFTWHPSFDSPDAKTKRVAFFVSFATAGVAGFIHASFLYGLSETFFFYFPVFKSLMFYGFGVIFYALFFPERFFQFKIFDYFGMSHNLWHICVFGGIYFHYTATVRLLENARAFSGCPAVY